MTTDLENALKKIGDDIPGIEPPKVQTNPVRAIRVVKSGVQAEVYLGFSGAGVAWLTITAHGSKVMAALAALEAALVDEADGILIGAQEARRKAGRRVLGG